MFETQTKAEILERMLSRVSDDIDKRQGSVVYDLTSPKAIELALAYIEMENVLNLGFADTTYGLYLDMRAAERGIFRKLAIEAAGFLTFAGPAGTVIPAGTEASTSGEAPIFFVTTVDATVGVSGNVVVAATAEVGGVSGNVAAGAIKLVVGDSSGILTVINAAPFDGGIDDEADDALLQRYYEELRTPPTSGNESDYRKWAKSIAGVYDARVFSAWNGPGTVKVSLLAADKTAPGQTIVDAAATYIESMRPLNVALTVVGVEEVLIDITVTLTLKAGGDLTEATEQVRENIRAYLGTLAFNDRIVRYAKVAEAILNAADVLDYENLTVNNGTGNVQVDEDQVAVMGAVAAVST